MCTSLKSWVSLSLLCLLLALVAQYFILQDTPGHQKYKIFGALFANYTYF